MKDRMTGRMVGYTDVQKDKQLLPCNFLFYQAFLNQQICIDYQLYGKHPLTIITL